jgi:ABC-2 type transport system permease protein
MQNDPQVGGVFACGFSGALAAVSIDTQSLQPEAESRSVASAILVQTGSAQAVLFALFAGQFGVLSIINEQRAGTLQRMLVTPTPRHIIITGKLIGTVVMVIVQLLLLLAALTIIGSIIDRQVMFIWGNHFLALAAVILTLAVAVAGLGVLLTGLARTPEQVGLVGAILNIVMGAVGGGFGFPPVFPLAYLSLIYWGTDAFSKLSRGNLDIVPNLLALGVGGAILFAVGLFLFNRRVAL